MSAPGITILDFLDVRFPCVGRKVWLARLEDGRISDDSGAVITLATPYRVNMRLLYRREVDEEPEIPFKEEIVFRDDHILVVCKPHFVPVIPSGPFVNQCLLYRLKNSTGLDDLVPVNRLDRETAGLVMFSSQKRTRSLYGDLFRFGKVHKVYEAAGTIPREPGTGKWTVESRIVRGEPWFRSKNEDGRPNALTVIRLVGAKNDTGHFILEPSTGKQHQLRLHMTVIGSRIVNDFYYPELQQEPKTGFDKPLQLLAKELAFVDPVTGESRKFVSSRRLAWLQ